MLIEDAEGLNQHFPTFFDSSTPCSQTEALQHPLTLVDISSFEK